MCKECKSDKYIVTDPMTHNPVYDSIKYTIIIHEPVQDKDDIPNLYWGSGDVHIICSEMTIFLWSNGFFCADNCKSDYITLKL